MCPGCVSRVYVCVCLVCVCGLAVIIYNLKRGRSLSPPLFARHSVCVCLCACVPHFRFRLPLPLLLFIFCFAHCSTLSTLAVAEAFLLNKLQTQLTFHVFFIATPFALLSLIALLPLCPIFSSSRPLPFATHSPVTRLLQFSPLAFAFLQPLHGFFFIFLPLPDAFFNYVCIFFISPLQLTLHFFWVLYLLQFLICTLKFSILSA